MKSSVTSLTFIHSLVNIASLIPQTLHISLNKSNFLFGVYKALVNTAYLIKHSTFPLSNRIFYLVYTKALITCKHRIPHPSDTQHFPHQIKINSIHATLLLHSQILIQLSQQLSLNTIIHSDPSKC